MIEGGSEDVGVEIAEPDALDEGAVEAHFLLDREGALPDRGEGAQRLPRLPETLVVVGGEGLAFTPWVKYPTAEILEPLDTLDRCVVADEEKRLEVGDYAEDLVLRLGWCNDEAVLRRLSLDAV